MNALELLKRDHDTIMALLTGANAYVDVKRLFERIKSELEMHSYLEETLFYPILQHHELLKDLARDAKAQHGLIQELLNDLAKQEGAEFEKNFQTLKAEVQLHFTGEENEIFPQVASLKPGPDLGQLGTRLETDKKEYQSTHGSPM